MTKSSYRMLKWTFLAAMAASLGTACVVSSGDGDGGDTDIDDGGSSGKTGSQGGKSGGGTGGKGGTTSGSGGTGGGSAGTGDGGSEPNGGTGGTPPTYVAGLCDGELGTMTPSELPSCTPNDKDEQDACLKCMKASCCEDWQLCYGKDPTSACGWGATSEEDLGQFDCIQTCFTSTFDGSQEEGDVLADCESMCLNQCEDKDDGFATTDTQALLECTRTNCLDECYPPKE